MALGEKKWYGRNPVATSEPEAVAELRRLLAVASSDDPYVSLVIKSDKSLCVTSTTSEMEHHWIEALAQYVYLEGMSDLRLASKPLAARVLSMLMDMGYFDDFGEIAKADMIDMIAKTLSTPTDERPNPDDFRLGKEEE
jgi:hypothetical protein